jgi:hypothetical protein
MRLVRPRLAFLILVALGVIGCGNPTEGSPEIGGLPSDDAADRAATPVTAAYGELEPRVKALEAFNGDRGAVTLRMTQHSVEGVAIVSELTAREGRVVLSIDERADGGGIRTYTLDALALARYVPSRWVGNVEVEKDHLVAVTVAAARAQPGVYLLVHPRCLTNPCAEVF